ncbi:hypothetical protein ACH347_22465 [Saccharopolyspora sp. 5N102]|uniref:hypothetical protein n=1 Tax=Saccharopolyspora sp. 5N102 TaxID=3375155 RepID=UPI0037A31E54
MTGFNVSPGLLDGVAQSMRDASSSLDSAATDTPPPQAGAVTPDVIAGLATLCTTTAAIVKGLAALGAAVSECAATYSTTDQDQAAGVSG